MHAINLIKRHIFRLPRGKIFTTREMLPYGTRSAIDQAMCKLVKQEVIVRLARGVFVREGSDLARISMIDIARAKAESFGRKIAPFAGNLAARLGFTTCREDEPVFATNGSSSSFRCGDRTVHFRKTCPRKMLLSESETGQLLSALWHIGQMAFPSWQTSMPWLGRQQKEEIRPSAIWLPAWLSAQFMHLPLSWQALQNPRRACLSG